MAAVEKQTHDLNDNWPLAILVSEALHKHSHAWAFPTSAQTPISQTETQVQHPEPWWRMQPLLPL